MRDLYLIISLVITGFSSAQVFSEDFQGLNGNFQLESNLIHGGEMMVPLDVASPCMPTTSTEVVKSCNSYLWSENGTIYTSSGLYNTVVPYAEGGDRTITLDLTIYEVDVTISLTSGSISSNENDAIYQWIDCRTNKFILDEISQEYFPTETGLYAVIVTKNGCTDTSDCVFWENVRTLTNSL